jgi:hydroxymethylbilane synthase
MTPVKSNVLRLGTRGSLLARTQSGIVAGQLEMAHPDLKVELVVVSTGGDRVTDRPLIDIGGKGLFTKEIEEALLSREIDAAVHSYKDVPVTEPLVTQEALVVAAVPKREDARDVLVSAGARSLNELSPDARIGTGSLRRKCQLLAARPELHIEGLRGNIDTRLRRLHDGQVDAIVLAAAGLLRSGLFDRREMRFIDPADLIPAAGQGALALQCRRDDVRTREIISALEDIETRRCVALERSIIAALDGDCHSPIAAYARFADGRLHLRAAVGARDGTPPVIIAEVDVAEGKSELAVKMVLQSLVERGAERLLKEAVGVH